jgi:hypothetical protein
MVIKMKIKYYLPFALALVVSSLLFNAQGNLLELSKMQNSDLVGDAPTNQKSRLEWELMRHRDPATGKIPTNAMRASLEYAKTLPGSYSNVWNKKDRTQANNWNLRGPINIGGRTRALAFDVLDENILLAGGVSGGMWRTTNFGITWTKTTKPDQLQSTSCIAQDKRAGKENVWYVGTGEYFNIYGGLRGDGVYKSTDGGLSWDILKSTVSNTPQTWDNGFDYVWNIVTDHTDLQNDVVLAATAVGAIQRSTDVGGTWKTMLGGFGNSYSWFTDIAISEKGIFYATLSQKTFAESASSSVMGIYRSENGTDWVNITPDFIPAKYRRVVIAISPSDENQVYFLAETPESGKLTRNSRGDSLWHSLWKYTYKSGDGKSEGGQWEDRSIGIPAPARIRSQFNSQGSYDLVIGVKPDNPEVVIIGGTNLYRSTDGFRTENNFTHIGGYCWDDTSCYEIYTYTNHHADEHAIIFHPSNPDIMLTGSDGGVAVTYDILKPHVDWTSLNNGYYTTQFYTCSIDHAIPGNPEILGGLQDNGTLYTNSNDVNKPWTSPAGADGFHCAVADSGRTYYTSNNTSFQPFIKIWRTLLDDDGNIIIKTRVEPAGARDLIWNTPFKLDPNNTRRMYLCGGPILWRNNNLDSIPITDSKDSTEIGWDSLTYTALDSFNVNFGRAEMITAVEISIKPANVVYYGTSYGRVFRIDNAHQGNPKPVNITGANLPKGANVGCVAVDPADANKVFVVFTNFNILSVFYSEDAGETWNSVSGNLEQYSNGSGAGPAVYYLEVVPVDGKNVYLVGTSTGVYSTSHLAGDYTVWQQEGAETLGNVMVYQIDSRHSDGYVVAASFGLGMFSTNISSLASAPQKPELLYPKADTTGVLKDLIVSWKPVNDAFFYRLEVSRDENFSSFDFEFDGLKTTEQRLFDLEQGLVKYYWRVTARGAGGMSLASDNGSFITAVAFPKISYPLENALEIELPVTLQWIIAQGADSYHLQLSESNLFNKIVLDSIISDNKLEVSLLADGKRYYWRISSIRNEQEGLYSSNYRFTTKEVISVKDMNENNAVRIEGNYPNPFSSYTKLTIFMKKEDEVDIGLFDKSGRKIRTLFDGILGKGEQSINIDATNLSSGNYFIILNSRGRKLTKQITVLK